MTITRTVSRLLIAAGFAAASLAFAQGQTETPSAPAAAPEVAPKAAPEGDPAPARSVLWPDFQVGQRAVLQMSYRDSSKSSKAVFAAVTVEVIDKTDDVFTIRWTPSDARIPRDFNGGRMLQFLCIWNGAAGPTVEILVQENVGVIAIKNWEAARDQAIADARKSLQNIAGPNGEPATPEEIDAILAPFTESILASRDGVEATLLKSIRGYFDGSYHELEPGDTATESVEILWPFGNVNSDLTLPMDRTTSLKSLASDPAPIYELSINLEPNAERFKELVKTFGDNLAEELKTDDVNAILNSTVEYRARWRFDTAKGWPTRASSTNLLKTGDQTTTQTTTWSLVEGPTMKAVEGAADTKPAQLEPTQPSTAQPKPAPAPAAPSAK